MTQSAVLAASGDVSTIAGGGIQADGSATDRALGIQIGLAEDGTGHVWIGGGSSLVKVTPDGSLTTVLRGTQDIRAIAFAPDGDVYFAESVRNIVSRLDTQSGSVTKVAGRGQDDPWLDDPEGILATDANLNYPSGLAVDELGNLYISDTHHGRVRRLASDGRLYSFAGGSSTLSDGVPARQSSVDTPMGLTWHDGSLYIAEYGTNRVRRVDSNGVITTVAGSGFSLQDRGFSGDGGPATSARLWGPRAVTFDSSDNMYIADGGNVRIRRVEPSGRINTFAGNGLTGYSGDGGPATSASFDYPMGVIAATDGKVYISDFLNKRTRVVANGLVTTFAGNGTNNFFGDGGPATSAGLSYPTKSIEAPDGSLIFSDATNHAVRRIAHDGSISTLAGSGFQRSSGDGGPATLAQLNLPQGLGFGPDGSLFVAEGYGRRIRRILPNGQILTVALFDSELDDLVVRQDGSVFVTEPYRDTLWRVDPDTGAKTVVVGGAPTSLTERDGLPGTLWRLWEPRGLFLESDGDILIADRTNRRILRMDPNDNVYVLAGRRAAPLLGIGGQGTDSKFGLPRDVFTDVQGRIYVLNDNYARLYRLNADESPIVVAGTGVYQDAGDGGSATSASFNSINSVTQSAQGGFFVSTSNRIRYIEP